MDRPPVKVLTLQQKCRDFVLGARDKLCFDEIISIGWELVDLADLFGYIAKYPTTQTNGKSSMDPRTKALFEARAQVIKALGHPTRLFVVDELSRGERCVCELQEMVGSDMSTVSKHLSVLKTAGIISDDKRGNQVFYSLLVPCVTNFFGCVETVLQLRAQQTTDLLGLTHES